MGLENTSWCRKRDFWGGGVWKLRRVVYTTGTEAGESFYSCLSHQKHSWTICFYPSYRGVRMGLPWCVALLHSLQSRWSDIWVWRSHGTRSIEEGGRWRMFTRDAWGFLLEWGLSLERAMLRAPGFCSFLHLLSQSLAIGVSQEALLSEPAFPLVHWLQLLPCTYVGKHWRDHQGAEHAVFPIKCIKVSPVSRAGEACNGSYPWCVTAKAYTSLKWRNPKVLRNWFFLSLIYSLLINYLCVWADHKLVFSCLQGWEHWQ